MKNYIIIFLILIIIALTAYVSYTVYVKMTTEEEIYKECVKCEECAKCETCKKSKSKTCDIMYNKKLYNNINKDIDKFVLSYKPKIIKVINGMIDKIKLPSTKTSWDKRVKNIQKRINEGDNLEKRITEMLKGLPSKSFKQCLIDIAPTIANNDVYLNVVSKFIWNLNISKQHISSNDADIMFSIVKYLLNQPIVLPPKVVLYFLIPIMQEKRKPDYKFLGQFICDIPAKYVIYIITNLLTMDIITDNLDSEEIDNIKNQLISDIDTLCSC